MSAIPKPKYTIEEYIEFDKNNEGKREYLVVSQDRPYVSHYVRQPSGKWLRSDLEGTDSIVKLASLDCELDFSEIYRLVKFSPIPTPDAAG